MADNSLGAKVGQPVVLPIISAPKIETIVPGSTGTTTWTLNRIVWTQDGEYLNGHYEFFTNVASGATGSTLTLPLPTGLTINDTYVSNAGNIAIGQGEFLSTTRLDCVIYYSSGSGIIVRFDNGSDLQTMVGTDLAFAGRRFVGDIRVPITQFAGQATVAYGAGLATSITPGLIKHYSEGTFTPSFANSTSGPTLGYSVQHGSYAKVGRQVTFAIRLTVSSVSVAGSGIVTISGLPFAPLATPATIIQPVSVGYAATWGSGQVPSAAYIDAIGRLVLGYRTTVGGDVLDVATTGYAVGTQITVSGSYQAAS